MYGTKLCMNVCESFGVPIKEQIAMLGEIGFEGFFNDWKEGDDFQGYREVAEQYGMIYQSMHAPFMRMHEMWKSYGEAKSALDELLRCLKDCADNGVPIMVCHAYIGFGDTKPTDQGVQNFKILVDAARELGVSLAFENTEGEEYLEKLMEAFIEEKHVGFCWDTGHEMCYNHGKDMLRQYGPRLMCTHLNDNLGIRDYHGMITSIDDLHLLPFDGIADWTDITARLNTYGYQDILTFELGILSKPNRHENDAYGKMSLREYFTEAYKRACRVAELKRRGMN